MSKDIFGWEEKQRIVDLVSATYAEYGCTNVRPEVRVGYPKAIISVNHENPYMGSRFWDFLTTMQERLKSMGYMKTGGDYFGDFYVIEFEHS